MTAIIVTAMGGFLVGLFVFAVVVAFSDFTYRDPDDNPDDPRWGTGPY